MKFINFKISREDNSCFKLWLMYAHYVSDKHAKSWISFGFKALETRFDLQKLFQTLACGHL